MTIIALDIPNFRALFAPAFSNVTTFPDIKITMFWGVASGFISDKNRGYYCGTLTLEQQTYALNLMTAHLLYINNLVAAGSPSGVVTGATIDKVSVQLQPPPEGDAWTFWLNQSPYGQQLLALLSLVAVGGFYIGGAPEIAGFRRVGGLT